MAYAQAKTLIARGLETTVVCIETNIGSGLPGTTILGSVSRLVGEAKDRLRVATRNNALPWPKTKLTINCYPAGIAKNVSHLDMAFFIAIMQAQAAVQIPAALLKSTVFLGEIGLQGEVLPVDGLLNLIQGALDHGIQQVLIPYAQTAIAADFLRLTNDSEASSISIYGMRNLGEVISWAQGSQAGVVHPKPGHGTEASPLASPLDMSDIIGQKAAKEAAVLAAIGRHHFCLLGPPGSGKSMLAHRLPTILPALTPAESISSSIIHDQLQAPEQLLRIPPFLAPHHSITKAALLGGGHGSIKPGIVSLAHHGVLFLDEASEVPASILDLLRTPIEQGQVRIARAQGTVVLPARFQLILAANECQCGAVNVQECSCSAPVRRKYLRNISGPLRDRIDLVVRTEKVEKIRADHKVRTSTEMLSEVQEARNRSAHRWKNARIPPQRKLNGLIPGRILRRDFPASEDAMELLAAYVSQQLLTQRGVDKALRVAWTLCDHAGRNIPSLEDVGSALEFQSFPGQNLFA